MIKIRIEADNPFITEDTEKCKVDSVEIVDANHNSDLRLGELFGLFERAILGLSFHPKLYKSVIIELAQEYQDEIKEDDNTD
jgi:hypothetical protein